MKFVLGGGGSVGPADTAAVEPGTCGGKETVGQRVCSADFARRRRQGDREGVRSRIRCGGGGSGICGDSRAGGG